MINTNGRSFQKNNDSYSYQSRLIHQDNPKFNLASLDWQKGSHRTSLINNSHSHIYPIARHQSFQFLSKQSRNRQGQLSTQNKRHTLQYHVPPSQFIPNDSWFLSRTNSAILNHKVSFTYSSPVNHLVSPKNTMNSISQFSQYERDFQQKINVFKIQKLKRKKIRNKLCTLQFSITYFPKRKNNTYCMQRQSDCMASNNFDDFNSNTNCKSKIASTIATQSFFQNRRSDFSSQDKTKNIYWDQKISYFGNNLKEDLIDIIPTDKQLGKTIIIQTQDYSFGGVMHQNTPNNPFLRSEKAQSIPASVPANHFESRQWNSHVKCLISSNLNDIDENLKQSIHQGPDIRQQHHKFQLLNDFGRQIKQSTMEAHHE